jgi:hypothetical protein
MKSDRRGCRPACGSHAPAIVTWPVSLGLARALISRDYVRIKGRNGFVTKQGLAWCRSEQIGFEPKSAPSVRLCMDWTERSPHLAEPFPNAVLRWLMERKFLRAGDTPRALELTPAGRSFFQRLGVRADF